ncbi:transposable element Tcb2 transposase [Trichonephila clavipes]|nr:transposable element Tcb2 transposase [Trichonephila clavipes]
MNSTGLYILSKLARLGQRKQVCLQWIPSHVGVQLMSWLPPAHHWYAAKSPGLSLQCRSSRAHQTALARFRNGHLRGMTFVQEPRIRIQSQQDDNRVRVWRPSGERLNPVFTLQQHTAPTVGTIFQQDNDRPHMARVSQDCLRTVTTLSRPSRSPDLSPKKHIWDHLG